MDFIPNEPISKETIQARKDGLTENLGISQHSINKLASHARSLCDPEVAQLRMDNLVELGFDAMDFAESNPTILKRKRATVTKRFNILRTWFISINKNINIHKLLIARPQLWSVGRHKLMVISLLMKDVRNEVTPERICNLITFNLENILLAFICGQSVDLKKLCNEVYRRRQNNIFLCKSKYNLIVDGKGKLPDGVFEYYDNYCHKK